MTSKAAARLRAAAAEVFAERGYGDATTREIAARLDLSPAAMYPHYKTKESLLFAISLEGHEEALQIVLDADASGSEASGSEASGAAPTERLRTTVAAYVAWHARHHALARVVQYELHALTSEHFDTIAVLRRATSNVFRRILDDGAQSGEFALVDIPGTTLAITSLGIDVSRWFPSKTHSDPTALGLLYAGLCLRMVGAVSSSMTD